MSFLKTKSDKINRIFAFMTLLVVFIDTSWAIFTYVVVWGARGTRIFAISYFPLLLLGYFLWMGRKFAAILLSLLLIAHGLFYLYAAAGTASVLLLMLAVVNIVAAVSSILTVFGKFRKLEKK